MTKKEESRKPDGSVRGSYSYVSPDGRLITNNYVADASGFRYFQIHFSFYHISIFLIYRITWSVKYIFHFLYRSSLSTGQADGVDPSHHDINSHFESTKENYAPNIEKKAHYPEQLRASSSYNPVKDPHAESHYENPPKHHHATHTIPVKHAVGQHSIVEVTPNEHHQPLAYPTKTIASQTLLPKAERHEIQSHFEPTKEKYVPNVEKQTPYPEKLRASSTHHHAKKSHDESHYKNPLKHHHAAQTFPVKNLVTHHAVAEPTTKVHHTPHAYPTGAIAPQTLLATAEHTAPSYLATSHVNEAEAKTHPDEDYHYDPFLNGDYVLNLDSAKQSHKPSHSISAKANPQHASKDHHIPPTNVFPSYPVKEKVKLIGESSYLDSKPAQFGAKPSHTHHGETYDSTIHQVPEHVNLINEPSYLGSTLNHQVSKLAQVNHAQKLGQVHQGHNLNYQLGAPISHSHVNSGPVPASTQKLPSSYGPLPGPTYSDAHFAHQPSQPTYPAAAAPSVAIIDHPHHEPVSSGGIDISSHQANTGIYEEVDLPKVETTEHIEHNDHHHHSIPTGIYEEVELPKVESSKHIEHDKQRHHSPYKPTHIEHADPHHHSPHKSEEDHYLEKILKVANGELGNEYEILEEKHNPNKARKSYTPQHPSFKNSPAYPPTTSSPKYLSVPTPEKHVQAYALKDEHQRASSEAGYLPEPKLHVPEKPTFKHFDHQYEDEFGSHHVHDVVEQPIETKEPYYEDPEPYSSYLPVQDEYPIKSKDSASSYLPVQDEYPIKSQKSVLESEDDKYRNPARYAEENFHTINKIHDIELKKGPYHEVPETRPSHNSPHRLLHGDKSYIQDSEQKYRNPASQYEINDIELKKEPHYEIPQTRPSHNPPHRILHGDESYIKDSEQKYLNSASQYELNNIELKKESQYEVPNVKVAHNSHHSAPHRDDSYLEDSERKYVDPATQYDGYELEKLQKPKHKAVEGPYYDADVVDDTKHDHSVAHSSHNDYDYNGLKSEDRYFNVPLSGNEYGGQEISLIGIDEDLHHDDGHDHHIEEDRHVEKHNDHEVYTVTDVKETNLGTGRQLHGGGFATKDGFYYTRTEDYHPPGKGAPIAEVHNVPSHRVPQYTEVKSIRK